MYPVTRFLWQQCHAVMSNTHPLCQMHLERTPALAKAGEATQFISPDITWNFKQKLFYMQEDPERAAVESFQLCSMGSSLRLLLK